MPILITLLLTVLLTTALAPERPPPDDLPADTSMPPLEGGAPADSPPISLSPRNPHTASLGSGPAIAVWQGLSQTAGHNGDPQKWFNLLGNVATPPSTSLASFTYRFNGGPWRPLNVGPNDRRLAMPGDFNVELDYTDLLPGQNSVTLEAIDSAGGLTRVEVAIEYDGVSSAWTPGNYYYDWSTATAVADLAQMVDGPWALDGDSVRPVVFDFDRLLALGDLTWRDYTVTVPITIYGIDPSGYKAPSNGPGIGVMVRWAGHYDADNGIVPLAGWRRLGALAWYRWSRKDGLPSEGLQLLGHGGKVLAVKARLLDTGVTYLFKIDIESAPSPANPATYRFKVWPAAGPEPDEWDIVKTGVKGEPTGGSLLLLAHHVDARFGPVTVDLKSVRPQPVLAVNVTGSGAVQPETPGPAYRFGEDVLLTAAAASGATFTGWTGPLQGSPNPVLVNLFESLSAGASFSGQTATASPFFISPAANGKTADGLAFAPADILHYDPAGGWSMWFDGSDVGITKNVAAFEILDNGDILLSFAANQAIVGLGTIAPQDIIRFEPTTTGQTTTGNFRMELDGSNYNLSTSGEKIDALGEIGGGRLALSTTGAAAVILPNGAALKAQDEDALAFSLPTGGWSAWFDGTPIPGLKAEDVNGLWIDPASGDVYLTLLDAFNLGGVTGNGRDIMRLSPAAGGGFAISLWWDGSAAGFPTNIDGLEIDR